ncbi:MAG: nicotinate-nucleotide adenylyltransferase [Alphaproteobacteria bacterium]|nr:nicotinate-nucleotide adenylyltransferase [Alphaproteobacteria bacterium]
MGLLGGSFNPAHEGHRAISLEALKRLDLDQVWWLVSPQNPLKSQHDMADFPARMASACEIAGGHPRIVVTDLERRIGTQYTVDTVNRLKQNGKCDFVWLIGADNLLQLPAWRNWKGLLNLVPIAVFDREPYSYKALAGPVAQAYASCRINPRHAAKLAPADPPAWVYFRVRRHRVSSTAIRSRQEWPTGKGAGATSIGSGTTEGTSS